MPEEESTSILRRVVGPFIIFLLDASVLISKMVIGGQYMGDCDQVWIDDEFMDVPQYLVITGGVSLGMNILTLFSMGNDKGFQVMVGGVILVRVSFYLYGSYLVFGNYGIWTHETGFDGMYYCAYTPFMFAYVYLVIWWVVFALSCCVIACCVCGCCSKPKIERPRNNVV